MQNKLGLTRKERSICLAGNKFSDKAILQLKIKLVLSTY